MQNESLTLSSESFFVQLDLKHASIHTLRNVLDRYNSNFVLDVTEQSEFDVEDSRLLGDLVFHVKRGHDGTGKTMTSGCSKDIRSISHDDNRIKVQYKGDSQSPGGFCGFSVVESYAIPDSFVDVFDWTIEVTNETTDTLTFEDFGIPVTMNSRWGLDQTQNYEGGVHRHSFVAGHGSYIYWQRPNGEGPMLIMTTHQNTSLEYRNRFREGEGIFGENLPHYEGVVEYYIHSAHVTQARADKSGSFLPATTLTLAPGQVQKYGFSFRWAMNYDGLRDAIYAAGGLDVVSMPGLVIPREVPAKLALRSKDRIISVEGEDGKAVQVTFLKTSNDYQIYRLVLQTLGPHAITVAFRDSRSTVLQYYCTEPLQTMIQTHAAFMSKHQQAKSDRGYNGAFLQWDMTTRKLITWDDYPGGGWKEWMAGGSDDLGLAPAAYLSGKCHIYPEQSEITSIDYYIEHFLFGYLLAAKDSAGELTFQVYRWFDGQDGTPKDTGIWRSYNYTHIANTFFNMYRIGKAYPRIKTRYSYLEYLRFAYEVLKAMYSKIPVPNPIGNAANELGLMGEATVLEIIETLQKEGWNAEGQMLQEFVERKLKYYRGVKYPFASEQTIDTTGFESVYAFAKSADMRELVDKTQRASLACRGLQPLWYFYGGDNRMMGESYWNLGYETQLGAWQQLDYLVSYSSQDQLDFANMLRSSYGAYLAGWANINSGQIDTDPANIGAAAWLFQSEGGSSMWGYVPLLGKWWAWSGEADLGFWGALRCASVFVVEDPVVGLYAYGGEVTLQDENFCVQSWDGVQRRLTMFNLNNLTVTIDNAQFSCVLVGKAGDYLEIDLQHQAHMEVRPVITVKYAATGEYEAFCSGSLEGKKPSSVEDSALVWNMNETSADRSKVIIKRIVAEI